MNDALTDGRAPEVVKRLTHGHPEARVLRYSGFPRDFLLREGTLTPEEPFLEKPFRSQELLQEVRRILGSLPGEQKQRRGGGSGT
ncbi:MAG TPA: hypothetical protein VN428_24965 [Bryobacteraceae bacterium]|nr:hypothetical protein [Bryobacteraceae bacterium]